MYPTISYAQTELGHGSALSRLETTATLDIERDQWVINSPTQSSAKFWIGTLGKIANHAAVQAKLIINGKDYGAHPFLVPLRSLKDHTPLPGIVIKDQGPKQGAIAMDNGYARFNNVRIPRENVRLPQTLSWNRNDGAVVGTTEICQQTLTRFHLLAQPLADADAIFPGVERGCLLQAPSSKAGVWRHDSCPHHLD